MRRLLPAILVVSVAVLEAQPALVCAQYQLAYRVQAKQDRVQSLHATFTEAQLALLEKLNRADVNHLERLREVVMPESWVEEELSYAPFPSRFAAGEAATKFLVVHLAGQAFGAYEFGNLVRWGPVSSGARDRPTDPGLFALNWRSTGRASTVDPDWFMRWYFNFGNREGFAFHAYALPGYPASHGCIRLLARDAEWLFDWGEAWVLDSSGTRVLMPGTPVLIVGEYDFDAPPPWRSLAWLSRRVELSLPPMPLDTPHGFTIDVYEREQP